MKYNIPHKNLINFLQDEIKNSELGFILNTKPSSKSYIGYSDIYSILSIHIKKYATATSSLFDLNDYHRYPQELKNEIDLIFNTLKQAALYIENNSLNSNQIKNTIKDILSELPYPPSHWDTEFDYNHLFLSTETFKDFANGFELLEFNKISHRVYSEYNPVNINFGDETGTPEKSISDYESLFQIACLAKRLDTSEPITVETSTPENVVQALFPKAGKFTDDPYNQEFSFKNTDFLDTINEEIVDESFIQVATIEILLPNIESYLEDLQAMIAQYGEENYFLAAKAAIMGKANKNDDLEVFLEKFYQFIEKIPKEIMLNDDELQQIVDLFNRPCPELSGYPLIPPVKRTLANSPYSNIVAIEFMAFIKSPPSLEKMFFYLPTEDAIHTVKSKLKSSYSSSSNVTPITLIKGHQEDWGQSRQSLDVLTPILNKYNNPYRGYDSFKEYYQIPHFNIDEFLALAEKHPNVTEQVALFNTIFKDFWNVSEVRSIIISNLLEFASQDIHNPLETGHFDSFIQDLSKDEIQSILDDFTSKYKDYDSCKNQFSPKGTLLFNHNEKTIMHSLINLQNKKLTIEFVESLEDYQKFVETLNNETNDDEIKAINDKKALVVEKFLTFNEFALTHEIEANSLLHINYTLSSHTAKINISKRFSEVQETFIFDFFHNELFQNTSLQLTKQIFSRDFEHKKPFKHSPNQFYEHHISLEKESNTLANNFLSFIHMDELMAQKTYKENYTTDKWLNFLSKNIGGDMSKVVQHVINQSKYNLELLQKCQELASKKRIASNNFNISNSNLRKIWEDPEFKDNALNLYALSHQVLDYAPDSFTNNPQFWIEIIQNSDYLSSEPDNIIKATQHINKTIMEHHDLAYDLFMLHSFNKDIQRNSKNYNDSNFYKSLCHTVQKTFTKPKYILKLIEEVERRNTSWNIVKDANPNLFKFICDNNIGEEEIKQKITVIIHQSIMDKKNEFLDTAKPGKGLKF